WAPVRSGSSRSAATPSSREKRQYSGGALDLFRVDGKAALDAGGGRGLGRQLAAALSQAGANVVICSRRMEQLEEARRGMEKAGGRVLALACDVTEPEDVERVVSAAFEEFGGVDVLVNNSGATWGAPAVEMP